MAVREMSGVVGSEMMTKGKFTGVLTRKYDNGEDGALRGDPPVHVPSVSTRYRAPALLLLGASCAFAAFVGSMLCMVKKFLNPKYHRNIKLDIDYESGMGYWPETVSESVSDSNSAEGKIFFTFSLIAGICLLVSFYPYSLRNVYTGPAKLPGGFMYWATFRQYVPVLGLFTLIGVSVYPTQIAKETNGGMICLCIHLTGAAMMFVGYMMSEYKCMEMFGMKLSLEIEDSFLSIQGTERCLRQVFGFGMLLFYCLFCVFEVLMVVWNPCCADKWLSAGQPYNRTIEGVITHHVTEEATPIDTATGTFFWFKVGAYTGECVAGVFLILSHLTIWYYCEERHVKYGDSMLDLVFDDDTDDDKDDEDVEDDEDKLL